jgi:ribosome biogenesis GTPase
LPRETTLTRTADDAQGDERVVVANVDTVFVVLTASYLDVGVRFLDRVLVAASAGGLSAGVVINKIDLVDNLDEANAVASRYETIGCDVWLTSAITGEGVDALDQAIGDRWVAFAGHSGVGKSSLLNRLIPDANQRVAAVGRHGGRHTTVAAKAWPNRHGGWLIDTPGVRSFGLAGVTPAALARHFPELAGLNCALDDCAHDSEPGCSVATATIHPKRKEAYERLKLALTTGTFEPDDEANV